MREASARACVRACAMSATAPAQVGNVNVNGKATFNNNFAAPAAAAFAARWND